MQKTFKKVASEKKNSKICDIKKWKLVHDQQKFFNKMFQ